MKRRVLGFCLLLLGYAFFAHNAVADSKVYSSASDIRPLNIGAKAPNATVQTPDNKDIDLHDAFKKQRTVLIFYRGGW